MIRDINYNFNYCHLIVFILLFVLSFLPIISAQESLNKSNDDFFIFSALEGLEYSFDLFEFLLNVWDGVGEEYNVSGFLDTQETPNSVGTGIVYTAKVGDYGLFSELAALSYCGDGICDEDESCSICPEDCGECLIDDGKSSRSGGGTRLIANESEDEDSVTSELVVEEKVEKIPENLFDIRMNIENIFIKKSKDLTIVVTYESFGKVPTLVNLTFQVFDLSGKLLYEKNEDIIVAVEEVQRYFFDDLDLKNGEYEFVFITVYGDSVKDEFRQKFLVKNDNYKKWIWIVLGILVVFLFIWIGKRMKKKRKSHKKRKVNREDDSAFIKKLHDIMGK